MKRKAAIVLVLAMTAAMAGCGGTGAAGASAQDPASADKDQMTQISTVQALTAGDFTGSVTMQELLAYGDTGLGTVEGVDGELIIVDGKAYQALGDGTVKESDSGITVPFACVGYADDEFTGDVSGIESLDGMTAALDRLVSEEGENYFYVCRVDGTFTSMHVRSEDAAEKPYDETLTELLADGQHEFTYEDVEGTCVCIYCPSYASGINASGWHVHFISKDREKGGHVLGLECGSASAVINKVDSLNMLLPDGETFKNTDLNVSEDEVEKVEKGR